MYGYTILNYTLLHGLNYTLSLCQNKLLLAAVRKPQNATENMQTLINQSLSPNHCGGFGSTPTEQLFNLRLLKTPLESHANSQ